MDPCVAPRELPAGKPSAASQAGELASAERWVARRYHAGEPLNLLYELLFGLSRVDYAAASVLDIGAGPISVFEQAAPAGADVVPYDTLADSYNSLIPDKKFPVVSRIPERRFGLVALLNCLDHMDEPEELLVEAGRHLAPGGTLWVYVNIDRPYEPALHPQDFKFWGIIPLVHRQFEIARCGLVREGRLFPYAFWAVGGPRRHWPAPGLRGLWRAALVARCGLQYVRFHAARAAVKAVKLAGLGKLLPPELRF